MGANGSFGTALTEQIPNRTRRFSIGDVDWKGSFADIVLNVIILLPSFIVTK